MTSPQRREGDVYFDDKTTRSVDYGLGIEHIDLDGGDSVWLGHGGRLPGYRSVMAVHLDTSDVVVIVTNQQHLDLVQFARDYLNGNETR